MMVSHRSKWPNGARAAVAFTIDNMGEAADLDRGLWPAEIPVGSHYSVTEVLPRFLDLLRAYKIPATYFIESWNLAVYPDAVKAVAMAGHEVAWHGWRHEAWNKQDFDAEQVNFRRSFGNEGLAGFMNSHKPTNPVEYRGFRPPGGVINGERTLNLCRQYGLSYISPAAQEAAVIDLNDGTERIAILPFRWSTVDAYYYMTSFAGLRKIKGKYGEDPLPETTLVAEYCREIDDAIENGGYRSVLFHPFLTAHEKRLAAMDTVMKYLAQKRDEGQIWLATCHDVAEWLYKHPSTVDRDPDWDFSSWR
ncbi:hypothetical protein M433DRAFT_131866 [Acidomyces richmondensis BFW]|nr:hypothetical protein M433DRAFT_131866 [Acidomyces richmondensis BFW]